MTHSAQDSESDKGEDQVNPLIIPLETAPSQEETTGELLVPILSKKRMDGLLQVPSSGTPNDFEIIPVPPTDSSDSSSDESGDDIDSKPIIFSVAKKLILKKAERVDDR
ncbi:hypothetical protein RDI58_024513 [Solanum bulbocastanum]|uniref:Uncharacterized protein n=1 Tax=Solanum bulbocastanum TaxID=147425 RepID=A0AAN8T042_SOLBU